MPNMREALGTMNTALHGGEQILAWTHAACPGDHGSVAGVLAVTSERILFHGLLNHERDQSLPLNSVIAADLKRGINGHLTFITVTGSVRFDVSGLAAARWLSAAEAQMQRASRGTPQVIPAPSPYVYH